MKIKVTTTCNDNYEYKSISDYIEDEQDNNRRYSGGKIENAVLDIEFTSESLGVLLDVLAEKGIINTEEVVKIVTGNNYDKLEFVKD